jgi:hypothetical protein
MGKKGKNTLLLNATKDTDLKSEKFFNILNQPDEDKKGSKMKIILLVVYFLVFIGGLAAVIVSLKLRKAKERPIEDKKEYNMFKMTKSTVSHLHFVI